MSEDRVAPRTAAQTERRRRRHEAAWADLDSTGMSHAPVYAWEWCPGCDELEQIEAEAASLNRDELRKAAMLAVHDNWPTGVDHRPGCDTMQEAVSRALLSAGDKAAPTDE